MNGTYLLMAPDEFGWAKAARFIQVRIFPMDFNDEPG